MSTITHVLEPTSGPNPQVRPDLPEIGEKLVEGSNWVQVYSRAHLPSRFGDFQIIVFRSNSDSYEHVAMVRGVVRGISHLPMRIHSECLTGDVMGSLKCDCRDQLEYALSHFGSSEVGLLLYMRQEGRGIGLGNKIRAYALQDQGMDTVDANRHLGFDDDLRDYTSAALMTRMLGPTSVELYTNNPRKILGMRQMGVQVETRQPILIEPNDFNEDYLATKARRSGHLIPVEPRD